MNRIYFILIVLFLGCVSTSKAQTLKRFLKAADEAMENKNYYNAMYYYGNAIEFDTTDINHKYNYAEAARNLDAYPLAELKYQEVLDHDEDNIYPNTSFYLADVQQSLGKYEEAKRNYELYISENSSDTDKLTAIAQNRIEHINWAINQRDNPAYGIEITQLGNDVNSPYTDFGAVKKGDEFYYSSLRYASTNDDRYPSKLYSKVIKSENPTIEEREDEKENIVKKEDKEKSVTHEAHTAFNHDGTKVYFTMCEYVNDYDIRCDLYVKAVGENNAFGKGTKLPASINAVGFTNTQPNLAYNEETGKETLYFVSDRNGGEGGLDIWYSEINDGEFSEPKNLTYLNTGEDEITPFFHGPTSTLFFSSEGYPGLGGFDVFRSTFYDNTYTTPENLLAPTNTSFNDIYYVLDETGTEGFMSSNRIGSQYLQDSWEACCYDIYKLDIEEVMIDINALVFDDNTEEPLPGSRIRVYDKITGELLYDNINSLENKHNFQLKCGRKYTIITDRDGYDSDTTSLHLKDCLDKEITKKIYLTPQELKLDVYTLLEPSNKELNGATVTLYDITDLDSEPIIITNSSGNDFHFDIIAGREYKVVGTKPGFEPVSLVFKALDIEGGVIVKDLIFKEPFFNLNEYLPVAVYFDNDRPDPRQRKLYTDKSYSDTYFPYYEKKELFKREYTKAMSQEQASMGSNDVDYFFETEVRGGYEKMKMFLDKLLWRLQSGDNIELSLKGFASPRAANKYNLALGQRRIWTLKNELKTHAGGQFKSFINSGQLKIIEISYGEETAPSSISDSYNNKRLSVYSVDASRQRKAEVFRVKVTN